jgi:hypothetical protein
MAARSASGITGWLLPGAADRGAAESPVDDALFDPRAAAFVDEVELKRIVRTVHVEALVALYGGFGFTAFHDVIALTVRAEHRDQDRLDLLHERTRVWHI